MYCADHPHQRGEYVIAAPKSLSATGSPPPAWGIRSLILRVDTPLADHPHQRGEYLGMNLGALVFSGSPPPAWGIHKRRTNSNNKNRITPTSVGNTFAPSAPNWASTDHPHQRGEYWRGSIFSLTTHGSPPPAWGIRVRGRELCN